MIPWECGDSDTQSIVNRWALGDRACSQHDVTSTDGVCGGGPKEEVEMRLYLDVRSARSWLVICILHNAITILEVDVGKGRVPQ